MFHRGKFLMTVVAVVVLSLSLTSCENVRKKFVRQKKKDQTEDKNFIPVLEPQEYPAPEKNPIENYKQHYSLIKAWYKDLEVSLIARYPGGSVSYALKQIFSHIDEMQKLLLEPMHPELQKLRGLLTYYRDSLEDPAAMRNVSRLQSDLRAFDRQLRSLNPGKIKDKLVPVVVSTPAADNPA